MTKLAKSLQDASLPSHDPFTQIRETGLIVRPATFDNLPAAVTMFNAAEREWLEDDRYTAERYEQDWRYPGFDLESATQIVLTPDGSVAGLVEVWDVREPPTHPWIWARVHPSWRDKGIGTAMMQWALSRARQAENRLDANVRLAPRTGTVQNHSPSTKLLEDLGMTPIRYSWTMAIELEDPPPPPQWPANISLQEYHHPQDAEEVYRAHSDAFRDHWGYIEQDFEEGFQQWKHVNFNINKLDTELWFIAMDGDEIAGIALCQPKSDEDPHMGWIDALGVRRAWRQQGLGLALLYHAFSTFHERGVKRVGLDVDSNNLTGATHLYQKAGMLILREFVSYEIELRPGEELAKTG